MELLIWGSILGLVAWLVSPAFVTRKGSAPPEKPAPVRPVDAYRFLRPIFIEAERAVPSRPRLAPAQGVVVVVLAAGIAAEIAGWSGLVRFLWSGLVGSVGGATDLALLVLTGAAVWFTIDRLVAWTGTGPEPTIAAVFSVAALGFMLTLLHFGQSQDLFSQLERLAAGPFSISLKGGEADLDKVRQQNNDPTYYNGDVRRGSSFASGEVSAINRHLNGLNFIATVGSLRKQDLELRRLLAGPNALDVSDEEIGRQLVEEEVALVRGLSVVIRSTWNGNKEFEATDRFLDAAKDVLTLMRSPGHDYRPVDCDQRHDDSLWSHAGVRCRYREMLRVWSDSVREHLLLTCGTAGGNLFDRPECNSHRPSDVLPRLDERELGPFELFYQHWIIASAYSMREDPLTAYRLLDHFRKRHDLKDEPVVKFRLETSMARFASEIARRSYGENTVPVAISHQRAGLDVARSVLNQLETKEIPAAQAMIKAEQAGRLSGCAPMAAFQSQRAATGDRWVGDRWVASYLLAINNYLMFVLQDPLAMKDESIDAAGRTFSGIIASLNRTCFSNERAETWRDLILSAIGYDAELIERGKLDRLFGEEKRITCRLLINSNAFLASRSPSHAFQDVKLATDNDKDRIAELFEAERERDAVRNAADVARRLAKRKHYSCS